MNEHERGDVDRLVGALQSADRVLRQARLLPDGELSKELIDAVRRDYRSYTDKHGIFDREVAEQLDIDKDALTAWRRGAGGTGGGDAAITRALNDWMERDARSREAALPKGCISTRVCEEFAAIANLAIASGCMAAISAPAGCGKSFTMKALADRTRGHYLYVVGGMTPRQFAAALAQAVDARGAQVGSQHTIIQRIVNKLKANRRPIFIDEAHLLSQKVLGVVRAVHDLSGVSIIMVGAADILVNVDDRHAGCGGGQMASRCIRFDLLSRVIDAEGGGPSGGGPAGGDGAAVARPLFSQEEVAAFLNNLQVRFDAEALGLLWALACLPSRGCFRFVERLVTVLRPDRRQRDERPITRRDILAALGLFGDHLGKLATAQHRLMTEAA